VVIINTKLIGVCISKGFRYVIMIKENERGRFQVKKRSCIRRILIMVHVVGLAFGFYWKHFLDFVELALVKKVNFET
jgi:hypothetical protein